MGCNTGLRARAADLKERHVIYFQVQSYAINLVIHWGSTSFGRDPNVDRPSLLGP